MVNIEVDEFVEAFRIPSHKNARSTKVFDLTIDYSNIFRKPFKLKAMSVSVLAINDKSFYDEIFILALCDPKERISIAWLNSNSVPRLCRNGYGGTPGNSVSEWHFPCVDAIGVGSGGHIQSVSGR